MLCDVMLRIRLRKGLSLNTTDKRICSTIGRIFAHSACWRPWLLRIDLL